MLKRLIAALALLLAPAALATTYPLTLKDDLGRSVTIPAEPRRIIALLPTHTETVFALGAGERLVGRDAYSDFPAEAARVPSVGDLFTPNLELILSLKPDLVLSSEYGTLTPALEKAGITVWAGGAQTFEDVFETISTIGTMLNREARAESINAGIRQDVRDIETVTRAVKKVSVYYEIDPTPYTVGPNSFVGSLLAKAGGLNIIPAALGDFPKINPEIVVAANPAVIVGTSREDAGRRPGWGGIPAVRNGRVHKLTKAQDDVVSRAGPRVAEGLRVLARILHPDLFR